MKINNDNWFVYIVKCSDGTFYTGCTKNIHERTLTHNSGKGAKYTRSRLPVELLYSEVHSSHSESLKREHQLKKLTRQQKMALIKLAST